MIFEFLIDESDRFFKGFQMVLTITLRMAKIGPRSSKRAPQTRSTFRERSVRRSLDSEAFEEFVSLHGQLGPPIDIWKFLGCFLEWPYVDSTWALIRLL